MEKKLKQLNAEFKEEIKKVKTLEELTALENKYLSRKSGLLTTAMKGLKDIAKEEVAEIGLLANEIKNYIVEDIEMFRGSLASQQATGKEDFTLPGNLPPIGHLHLVTRAIREIAEIFESIGFQHQRYPEVEWDYYSFETLNMPGDHPARDEWETFFIDTQPVKMNLPANSQKLAEFGKRILTPHTSSGQIREMEKGKLPIRMINIAKCYRRQIDVSHTPMFHQFEGLVVDRDINIANLKGTIDYFVKKFFGSDVNIRLRPHHFQFTEPSFEIDITCGLCKGAGCKMCKDGWHELGGSGMVHPNVLKSGGVDPDKFSGFAFGWGVERCLAMKPGLNIDDIRLLYKNDLRFNKQF